MVSSSKRKMVSSSKRNRSVLVAAPVAVLVAACSRCFSSSDVFALKVNVLTRSLSFKRTAKAKATTDGSKDMYQSALLPSADENQMGTANSPPSTRPGSEAQPKKASLLGGLVRSNSFGRRIGQVGSAIRERSNSFGRVRDRKLKNKNTTGEETITKISTKDAGSLDESHTAEFAPSSSTSVQGPNLKSFIGHDETAESVMPGYVVHLGTERERLDDAFELYEKMEFAADVASGKKVGILSLVRGDDLLRMDSMRVEDEEAEGDDAVSVNEEEEFISSEKEEELDAALAAIDSDADDESDSDDKNLKV